MNTILSIPLTPRNPLQFPHFHSHSLTSFPTQPNTFFTNSTKPHTQPNTSQSQDTGIPIDQVKTLFTTKSQYNYIRVLEVSRRADHPFSGSRLLLLDKPGNIHSIDFLFKTLTGTYFDVFATLPPVCPRGPVGVLGFGAGSCAKILLELYPFVVVHGWEIDPAVIDVGRKFFELGNIEEVYNGRVFVHIGDALKEGELSDGFAGILVDLFSEGSLVPELLESVTWESLKRKLRKGGRIMVNAGGSCVEAEDSRKDGNVVMEECLKAMYEVFGDELYVLRLGNRKDDSSLALTGTMPDLSAWKKAMPKALRGYVDMWTPYGG